MPTGSNSEHKLLPWYIYAKLPINKNGRKSVYYAMNTMEHSGLRDTEDLNQIWTHLWSHHVCAYLTKYLE